MEDKIQFIETHLNAILDELGLPLNNSTSGTAL